MGFLDDLLKDVEKGIDRVQQGADKLLSENALRSELEKLKRDQHDLLAEIGEEALALYAAGEIALPGMAMQIAQIRDVREKIEAKQAELTQVKQAAQAGATRNPPAEPAPSSAEAAETPAEEPTAPANAAEQSAAFCAECGAGLTEGAAFLPRMRAQGGMRAASR